ncbi:MAG: acyltransferase [Spirochaetes bacterium]|nr:MAG: acyltransferase [Spirochaetota bacterium]
MKRIGYFQFKPILGDPGANRKVIAESLKGIDADLIVLPELAFTGYSMRDRAAVSELTETPAESQSIDMLTELCSAGNCHIVAGFAEKDEKKLYNSAVLVGPDGLIGVYRKIHLFGFEKELFDPGPDAPVVYDIGGLKVGMMVCFDWFFPETARLLALAGADVIAHPSNLVLDWCQKSMITRCLENNLFAVTANRFGSETREGKELTFTGGSQITAPRGVILSSASTDSDNVSIIEIDEQQARDKNVTPANHLLNDRRVELYGGLM